MLQPTWMPHLSSFISGNDKGIDLRIELEGNKTVILIQSCGPERGRWSGESIEFLYTLIYIRENGR